MKIRASLFGAGFMTRLFHCIALAAVGGLSLAVVDSLVAQEPGWTSRVLKLGEERVISEQTPILERPYRPLHFYGNAVRRNHYRGNPWPLPRDILITTAFLAPTPREREEQLEQRLAGPNLLLRESDEDEENSTSEQDEAESQRAPESDAESSQLNTGEPTAESSAPGQPPELAGGANSPQPQATESSSRRGRRSRQ